MSTKIMICPIECNGFEMWVAKLNGETIGQAWSRSGVISKAKEWINAHAARGVK